MPTSFATLVRDLEELGMPSVLITSANRGLGFEFAQQYARDGWRVFGACRHPERARELEGLSSDGRVQLLAMDVTESGTPLQRSMTRWTS
jgi:NAD(P)-dependent dehydrogenase (short-subunit alcohol dehydrogenase family)